MPSHDYETPFKDQFEIFGDQSRHLEAELDTPNFFIPSNYQSESKRTDFNVGDSTLEQPAMANNIRSPIFSFGPNYNPNTN